MSVGPGGGMKFTLLILRAAMFGMASRRLAALLFFNIGGRRRWANLTALENRRLPSPCQADMPVVVNIFTTSQRAPRGSRRPHR